jgi:hypothetical protein
MSMRLTLPQTAWKEFFDRISSALLGKWAEIEVASLELGDQILAEWVPLLGIKYETHDDTLDIALDRVSHRIHHPTEIVIEEADGGVTAVDVIDAAGTRRMIRMKDPLMLPRTTSQVNV